MKKRFTKLAGGIMAASMILGTVGVAAPVFADPATPATPATNQITITKPANDPGTHEYTAYQVFSGELDGTNGLKNLKWGSGFANRSDENRKVTFSNADTVTKLVALFDGINVAKSGTPVYVTADNITDVSVAANAIDAIKADDAKVKLFSEIIAPELTVADSSDKADGDTDKDIVLSGAGYYMVKDKFAEGSDAQSALSRYILEVAGQKLNVTAKADVPTSTKTVKDDEEDLPETKTIDENEGRDNADYDIGDLVPFTLEGTVANDYQKYTVNYKYAFVDQACYGLDAPQNIHVYAVKSGAATEIKADQYTVSDYTQIENAQTTDEYYYTWSLSFNDLKTVKDTEGNVISDIDSIRVTYDAKLNENAVVGATGNRNKSHIVFSNNPYGDGEGNDEDTEVIVFTYKLVVDKVDGNDDALKGAGFTLQKKNATSGAYEDVKVKLLTETTGEGDAAVTKVVGAVVDPTSSTTEIKDADLTSFEWKGLDAGEYKLKETTVPEGYNAASDVEFKVVPTHVEKTGNEEGELTGLKVQVKNDDGAWVDVSDNKFTAEVQPGRVYTKIENNTGATLPSTGGIGTTIFYIVGAAAAVTAVVLLTARKRASKED